MDSLLGGYFSYLLSSISFISNGYDVQNSMNQKMMKILEEDLLRAETVEEIEHVKKEFVSMHYMNLYS